MPSLPGGISTCVVTFGKASGYRSDQVEIASIDAVLSADRDIVWSATGWSFRSANQSVVSDVDGSLSFAVPHVDQAGFVDRSGSGITNWEYTLTGFIRFAGRTEAFSKDFGPLVGQTTIDLDLVADGPSTTPVLSPTEYVTSVDGQTGAVSLTNSYEPVEIVHTESPITDITTSYVRQGSLVTCTFSGLEVLSSAVMGVVVPDGYKPAARAIMPTHDNDDGVVYFIVFDIDGSIRDVISSDGTSVGSNHSFSPSGSATWQTADSTP